MKKQDKVVVRTAVQLEQKHELGKDKGSGQDLTRIRIELADAIEKAGEELKQQLDIRVQAILAETDRRLAEALDDYVDDETYEAYQEVVTNTFDSLSGEIGTLSGSVDSLSEEVDGFSQELASMGEDITDMAEEITEVSSVASSAMSAGTQAIALAGGVANDVSTHFSFENGGTRILGAMVAAELDDETDLDEVLTPNRYIGGDLSDYTYYNCPVETGTFVLDVIPCGDEGQLLQRYTYSSKTAGKTFERVYYGSAWGAWFKVSDYAATSTSTEQKTLWEGSYFMNAAQKVTLSEGISNQASGIVLVFSEYDGDTVPSKLQAFQSFFIPKRLIALRSGKTHLFRLVTVDEEYYGVKELTITDTQITGNDNNGSDANVDNRKFILRYVFGV